MIFLVISAAFVGLVHSLAPGHWLPVVLVTRARRWKAREAVLGALVAASGHVFLSVLLGIVGIRIGAHLLVDHEEVIERYAGLVLAAFGVGYAALAYFRHSSCRGHEHHGPDPRGNRRPFAFLFLLGFSPCVAVLPVFAAAAATGAFGLGITMAAFASGVITALVGATLLVSLGAMKLDHPLLEHYGDVMTGLGVAAMGLALFLVGHF